MQPSLLVQHASQKSAGGPWNGWASLGLGGAQVDAAAENPATSDLEVMATQGSQQYASVFANQTRPGGSWSGWTGMTGSPLSLSPAVLQSGIFLVGLAASAGQLVFTDTNSSLLNFINWVPEGSLPDTVQGSSMAAVNDASGGIDVFFTGTHGIWFGALTNWSNLG